MSEKLAERLQAALNAEHSAIFAYARFGVLLAKAMQKEARAGEEMHRTRRDALLVQLAELKVAAPVAQAGYALPFPLTDPATALKLAAYVEDGVAATWRAALADAEGEVRRQVLVAYTDAAVRGTRWRRLGAVSPATVPYPGRKTQ
ncbi:ferritin-like domain-containing protein [Catellatospora sichuanensis]|uniref:ferritin-like domain-containing protein n=1 Tax=Catellatospora sichuanensis TaxID=1969805 RepID=UPI001FE5D97A|nr:ferritin-like domain-containing protein [Catellatospora sichuanensis]